MQHTSTPSERFTPRRGLRAGCALALAAGALLAGEAAAMEVKAFAIGDFVPSGSGGCGGGDRSSWPGMVDAWYDKMRDKGHTKDGQYNNGSQTIQRFCDPDWKSGCRDHDYLDEADAAMIATHGTDGGDHWGGTMRAPWGGHCRLDAGGSSDDMWVGDVDLEFIHLSSCFSADDDNLPGIRWAMTDPVDGGYAHQWDGFHGIMWISSGRNGDYRRFAKQGHSTSIAEAWVVNLYDNRVCKDGACHEQCPVAYSISTTETSALNRLRYERYNHVYSDPTGNNWYAYMYIEGCDPKSEGPFNP
jgi:hypothetical protein